MNDSIQIDVFYGLQKEDRKSLFYWNERYRHQIPEDAVIIGDTKNHGFIVYISRGEEEGIYYWDACYAFKCSNDKCNAYYITNSMGALFNMIDVDCDEYLGIEFVPIFKRLKIWKNYVSMRLFCHKKLRAIDASIMQQDKHCCNRFVVKLENTFTYIRKCKIKNSIEEFGKIVGYTFSEFFKEYVADNEYKKNKKPYFLSVNGFKGSFEWLLSFDKDAYNTVWDINLLGKDTENAIKNKYFEKSEELQKLHKDFIIFAQDENNSIAIDKNINSVVYINNDCLFTDEIADDFESFINMLCDEQEIKQIIADQKALYEKQNADYETQGTVPCDMKWYYVKQLQSKKLIDEFENLREYKFPNSFKECVILNNGGHPEFEAFDTEKTEERCISYFLSFNKDDNSTVWKSVEAYKSNIEVAEQGEDYNEATALTNLFNRYVIFAYTPFGDDIAFDKTDDSVVFIDHETLNVEKITNSFEEFLNCLYD